MPKLVSNITFKQCQKRDDFQKQLSYDIKNTIKSSSNALIKADKATNFYRMKKEDYTKALHERVTKTYKKIDNNIAVNIEMKSKVIAEKLGLDDGINKQTARKQPFITIKDHKPNFDTNPKHRPAYKPD